MNFDSIGRAVLRHEHCDNEDEYTLHQDGVIFNKQMVHYSNPVQETSRMAVEDSSLSNEMNEFTPKSPSKDLLENLSLRNVSEISEYLKLRSNTSYKSVGTPK